MNTLFLFLFIALGALYFILGWRASRKVTSDRDYFVANKQMGVWQISSNLIATQLGGGMLLGTAAQAYTTGYYGILYTLGMSLGFILLSCGVAARLQQYNVTTAAELFITRYNSIGLQRIASLLSIATLFGILIAQVVGFRSFMAALGYPYPVITALFWLSVVAYTMVGGLRAITINDMVQLGIIITTFSSIFIMSLTKYPLSTTLLSQKLFTPAPLSLGLIVSTIAMPALFSLIEQDLAQRFFASRSQRVATLSALNAGVFLLIFSLIPVYFGMQTKLSNLLVTDNANPLIVFLQHTAPPLLFAGALCAIIAAIISTADALINGISANVTQDFKLARYLNCNSLMLSKVTSGIIGIAALAASYIVPADIIGIIISSYELSVSCLLVPLVISYFKKDVRKNAALLSVVCGFIGFITFRLYPTAFPKEILALILSLIGYCIGHFIPNRTYR
jgi:SSS family solute:Na+ symporter